MVWMMLVAVAAGCGSDGDTSTASLPGTAWRLVSAGDVDAASGSSASLEFLDDASARGTTGCNAFNTSFEVDGSDLSFGPVASTLAGCADAELTAQESAFLQALEATSQFSFEGDELQLEDSEGDVVAVFSPFSAEVAGTSWTALFVNNGQEAVVSTILGTEVTLVFDDEGGLGGSAGCNSFNGSYEATGTEISIGPLTSTRQACAEPAGVMEQEQQYLAALETASTYQFAGDRLELRTDTGELAVSFAPAP